MKHILTTVLICFSVFSFAQSKRKINEQLTWQLEQVNKTNTSLLNEFYDKHTAIDNLRQDIFSLNEELNKQRSEIDVLRNTIREIKEQMNEVGDNPDQFVSENELNVIYSLVSQTNYQNEAEKVEDTTKFLIVEPLPDFSHVRMKTRNELLNAKIIELKKANQLNALEILQLKAMLEKLSRIKTTAKDQLDIAVKMRGKLEEKRKLLAAKEDELAEKRYEERVKMMVDEANKTSKKKKTSKVKVPVIREEVTEYISEDINGDPFGNSNDIYTKEGEEEPKSEEDTILYYADQMPEFPLGMTAFQKYLAEHLVYPQTAIDEGKEGKVYVKFVVTRMGDITNVSIAKGISGCKECDQEALRVIRQMPKWKPAKNKDESVDCYFTIPIIFKLVH